MAMGGASTLNTAAAAADGDAAAAAAIITGRKRPELETLVSAYGALVCPQ